LQLATVTATSTNDPAVSAFAQNSIQVTGVGVQLLPNNQGTARPGTTVVYSHTVVNTGAAVDTFAFSYASSEGWAVEGPDALQVAAGGTEVVVVRVTMPVDEGPVVDVTTVTATSTQYSQRQASATNTTIGQSTTTGQNNPLYLPAVQQKP
jgi:hypothetical protein